MSISDELTIPIECPNCHRKIKKLLSQLQTKQTITCTCGTAIEIDPAGFKSVAKSLADFQKKLGKLGK